MSKLKMILIAAGAAAVTLVLIMWSFAGHVGGDGPDVVGWIGMVLLTPALFMANLLGVGFIVPIVGFFQFFVIYLLGLMIWRYINGRNRV